VRQAEELCTCAGCRATLGSLRESLAGLPLGRQGPLGSRPGARAFQAHGSLVSVGSACFDLRDLDQGELPGQTDGLPLGKPAAAYYAAAGLGRY
jgi:hypothetical protein